MIGGELARRLAEHGIAGDIGAVVVVAPAHVETDDIGAPDRTWRGLNVGEGGMRAGRQAAQHRRPLLAHGAAVECERHVDLGRALLGDSERRLDRMFGDMRGAPQALDLGRHFDGAGMPEHVGRTDQLGLRQRLGQPFPVGRQDAEVIDPDRRAFQSALPDRRNQRRDRVAMVALGQHGSEPLFDRVERGVRIGLDREQAVAPHVGDGDLHLEHAIGDEVDEPGAGDDARRAASLAGHEHVVLRPAPDPLAHGPEAAGIGDVLRRGRHDRVEAVAPHPREQALHIHQHRKVLDCSPHPTLACCRHPTRPRLRGRDGRGASPQAGEGWGLTLLPRRR